MNSSLKVSNLSVHLRNCHILKEFYAEVPLGAVTIVMGPNGSGKSSLLGALTGTLPGILEPSLESLDLEGKNLALLPNRRKAKYLALMPQFPEIQEGLPVKDYFEFSRYSFMESPRSLSNEEEELQTEIFQGLRMTHLFSRNMDQLSGGELKKVSLGATLFQGASIVMLDEPFQALDPKVKSEVAKFLVAWNKKYKTTFLLASHDFYWSYKLGDYFLFLKRGEKLVEGNRETVFNEKKLEELFDHPFLFLENPSESFYHPVGEL